MQLNMHTYTYLWTIISYIDVVSFLFLNWWKVSKKYDLLFIIIICCTGENWLGIGLGWLCFCLSSCYFVVPNLEQFINNNYWMSEQYCCWTMLKIHDDWIVYSSLLHILTEIYMIPTIYYEKLLLFPCWWVKHDAVCCMLYVVCCIEINPISCRLENIHVFSSYLLFG